MSSVALNFVVVGGSVAGLSCARALARFGHNVLVVEMNGPLEKTNTGGGLRVPPNMARLLVHQCAEMAQVIEKRGSKCSGLEFRYAETSSLIGMMTFNAEVMSDLGSDFAMVPHYDICAVLKAECLKFNVHFRYGFKVKSVSTSEDGPSVVMSTAGEILECDIIIGADGRNSVVRNYVISTQDVDDEGDDCSESNSSAYGPPLREIFGNTVSVAISEMKKHDDLAPLVESSAVCSSIFLVRLALTKPAVYFMDGFLIAGGRHGDVYVLGQSKATAPLLTDQDKEWLDPVPIKSLELATDSCAPMLKKILGLSRAVHPTLQIVHRLESFSDVNGKAVVIGDAAHSAPINGTYNAALAVEDAFTLAHLFSRITSRAQISSLLNGYNEIRFRRTRSTERNEILGLMTNSMPPGPHRDLRDQGMKQTLEKLNAVDENAADLADTWNSWIVLFNYDAKDAVDEWWLNWGRHSQSFA